MRSAVPVMIARPAEYELPRTALVVVDEGAPGIAAARVALECVVSPGTVTLAHVAGHGEPPEVAARLYAAIIEALDVGAGITINAVTLGGAPIPAVERCEAERWEQLVVVP